MLLLGSGLVSQAVAQGFSYTPPANYDGVATTNSFVVPTYVEGTSAGTGVTPEVDSQLLSSILSPKDITQGSSYNEVESGGVVFDSTTSLHLSDFEQAYDVMSIASLNDIDENIQARPHDYFKDMGVGGDSATMTDTTFAVPFRRDHAYDNSLQDREQELLYATGYESSYLNYPGSRDYQSPQNLFITTLQTDLSYQMPAVDQYGIAYSLDNTRYDSGDSSLLSSYQDIFLSSPPVVASTTSNIWGLAANYNYQAYSNAPVPLNNVISGDFAWHFAAISTSGGAISGSPVDLDVPFSCPGASVVSTVFTIAINLLVVTWAFYRMISFFFSI